MTAEAGATLSASGVPVDSQPYPVMKDSGVSWLGQVPDHWQVPRLRHCAAMRVSNVDKHTRDDEQRVRLCNYTDVYKNDRIRSGMTFMRATATAEEIERFRLLPSDVLITKDSESWTDIGVPALVEDSADDLISGYHLALLRPFRARLQGDFLFRALQAPGVAYQFHIAAAGVTRYGLSHFEIKSIRLPLPPLPEQAGIVRFLDHADRRIRRYIRAKQKLILLLEEQKQAIIHRAVTRGLDANVRFKPCGVAWLGDVPEHWTVASLRFRYEQCLGKMVDAKRATRTRLLPYLRNVDVQWDRINTEDLPRIDIGEREHDRFTLREGDLLVCEGRHLGRAAIWRGELPVCAFQKALHRLRAKDTGTDLARYLYYCLHIVHFQDAFGASSSDNSIPHLTGEMLRAFRFPFPPFSEQAAIVTYLDTSCSNINRAQTALAQEVGAAREYRTRLMADVVTGKFDVREAAARLPPPNAECDYEPDLLCEADAGEVSDEPIAEEAEV